MLNKWAFKFIRILLMSKITNIFYLFMFFESLKTTILIFLPQIQYQELINVHSSAIKKIKQKESGLYVFLLD